MAGLITFEINPRFIKDPVGISIDPQKTLVLKPRGILKSERQRILKTI